MRPEALVALGATAAAAQRGPPLITTRTPVVPATLLNKAGLIGAAVIAEHAV